MGFYIRKSINVGPFRFNLSGSGVGVSTGIKGFRIGSGPRGNYIHMGRGGVYFRTTLPGPGSQRPARPSPMPGGFGEDDRFTQLETGTASQMVDSSSAQLLDEINGKAGRIRLWPFAATVALILNAVVVAAHWPLWLLWLTVPFSIGMAATAAYHDLIKKTVVLFYSMEPHLEEAYESLHNAFGFARACRATWQIPSERQTSGLYDWKTNSGVDTVVRRKDLQLCTGHPAYFKTNLSVPVVPAQRLKLYFFPDRILVYDGKGVGAVNYGELEVSSAKVQFHETGGVPSDAQVVGSTWRYVNKSGGPDRRFNDNAEIPIVLYEEVQLRSRSGLSEVLMVSRLGVGAELKKAVTGMAKAISGEGLEDRFAVCPCNLCSGHIEFPERGAGETIKCPFCGMDTVLFVPARSAG